MYIQWRQTTEEYPRQTRSHGSIVVNKRNEPNYQQWDLKCLHRTASISCCLDCTLLCGWYIYVGTYSIYDSDRDHNGAGQPPSQAMESQIGKGYRKSDARCHPDCEI